MQDPSSEVVKPEFSEFETVSVYADAGHAEPKLSEPRGDITIKVEALAVDDSGFDGSSPTNT